MFLQISLMLILSVLLPAKERVCVYVCVCVCKREKDCAQGNQLTVPASSNYGCPSHDQIIYHTYNKPKTNYHTHTHTHTRNDLLTHTPAVLLRRLWIFREGQISWGVNQWMNQSLPSWSLWCLVIKLTLFSTRSQLLPNLWIFDAHLPA